MARRFVRLKDDGRTVVFLLESVHEQEVLIEAQAEIDYNITDDHSPKGRC